MLTRAILDGYLTLKADKEQIEDEIAEFYESCLKSSVITDAPKNPQITDSTATLAEKAERLHLKLKYKQCELAESFEIIVNSIATLEPNLRQVIFYKYIKDVKCADIATMMNYHESRIWQLHGDALRILFRKKD